MEFQRNSDITKRQQGAEQEQGIDAITAFYQECADLSGVELSEWLDSEPF